MGIHILPLCAVLAFAGVALLVFRFFWEIMADHNDELSGFEKTLYWSIWTFLAIGAVGVVLIGGMISIHLAFYPQEVF
jgi:hypothetical protein